MNSFNLLLLAIIFDKSWHCCFWAFVRFFIKSYNIYSHFISNFSYGQWKTIISKQFEVLCL